METSKNIDLTGQIKFQTQFSKAVGDVDGDGDHDIKDEYIACCKASKLMIQNAGFTPVAANKRVDMFIWDAKLQLEKAPTYQDSIDLLNTMLDQGRPVLIGVNRKKTSVGNANKATSHFVVIVGREYNPAKARYEFRFYDPGTSYIAKGTNESNVFFKDDKTGQFVGESFYNKTKYTITEVRPTL